MQYSYLAQDIQITKFGKNMNSLQICFVSKDGRMETCSCENKHCGCGARNAKETKVESPRRAEPKISSRPQNKPSKPIRTKTTPKITSVIQNKPNNSAASSRGTILSLVCQLHLS